MTMVSRPEPSLAQKTKEVAEILLERAGRKPRVAMMLGTGHSSIAAQLTEKVTLHTDDVPWRIVPEPKNWNLASGMLEGVPVVVADAPIAAYEAHRPMDVAFPVRILHAMGAEVLILTAGAASLCPQLEAGTVAIVEDHINLSGFYPLQGPQEEELGPRFPDMSAPYTPRWQRTARDVAAQMGSPCLPGVFAAVPGPSLPTRAEYRFLRRAGADLVGMSLVPEVIAAVHAGLEVLALVGITQQIQVQDSQPVDIEAMIDAAELAAPRMASLLTGVVAAIR